MARRDVIITGLGVVSAAGVGWQACAAEERPRPGRIGLFDASGFPVQVAYQVGKVRPQPYMKRRKDLKLMSRDARLALVAAGLAVEDAGIDPMDPASWPVDLDEVALYMGVGLEPGDITELGPALASSMGEGGRLDLHELGARGIDLIPPLSALQTLPNMALAHIAINLGVMGQGEALSPWGTSGFDAVSAAAECVARGKCDVALAGAADSDIDVSGLARYLRMGLLAPLTEEDATEEVVVHGAEGNILGEGAAFFVLEAREVAEARGRAPIARIARQTYHSVPTPEMATFDGGVLAEALTASLLDARRTRVSGCAGHDAARRAIEAEAVARASTGRRGEVALDHVSSRVGWSCAASGVLELADLLARQRRRPDADCLVGLAWAPTGHYSTLTLDQLGRSGEP